MRSIEVLALIACESALALGVCSTFMPAECDSERQISAAEVFGSYKGSKDWDDDCDWCEKKPVKKSCDYKKCSGKKCDKKFIDEQLVHANNL